MAPVRRIVADVLKPHDPSLAQFAGRITDVDGVAGANATLIELDKEVQNVKLTVEGEDLSEAELESAIENVGASLHSIDEVAVGEYVVEERRTPQD